MPTIGGFTSFSGASNYGPAIAVVNGVPTVFVTGTDNRLYWRTSSQGWVAFSGVSCTGHPAAASAGTTSYVACHNSSDNALWHATNTGSGWGTFTSLGGVILDGPGIAGISSGPVFTAEGSSGTLYQNVNGAWQYVGGSIMYGAGATADAVSSSSTGTCPNAQSACVQSMLNILNNDRTATGVAPLTLNSTETNGTSSCVGSYGHSVHMAALGAISHDQFPADICVAYSTAGENVGEAGYGNELTDLQQLDQSMMSEPHDATTCSTTGNHACNIINPAFHQVGIGIYNVNNQTWLTEDFTN
jgi:uncharacterized protein YkwD